jgi:hypothetical protein
MQGGGTMAKRFFSAKYFRASKLESSANGGTEHPDI